MTETWFTWNSTDTMRFFVLEIVVCNRVAILLRTEKLGDILKTISNFLDTYCLYFDSLSNRVCSVSFKLQSINEWKELAWAEYATTHHPNQLWHGEAYMND